MCFIYNLNLYQIVIFDAMVTIIVNASISEILVENFCFKKLSIAKLAQLTHKEGWHASPLAP